MGKRNNRGDPSGNPKFSWPPTQALLLLAPFSRMCLRRSRLFSRMTTNTAWLSETPVTLWRTECAISQRDDLRLMLAIRLRSKFSNIFENPTGPPDPQSPKTPPPANKKIQKPENLREHPKVNVISLKSKRYFPNSKRYFPPK